MVLPAARRLASASPQLARQYGGLVAWGRNLEGQCGVKEFHPVLLRPMALEAPGLEAAAVAAGKAHSAAVSAAGEAWTWGEGSEGKLGHGCTDNQFVPSRVESLVGRTEVRGVALGRHHTLFVDGRGKVWSCGENKEGQCGLGTPLQELARQRRQEWDKGGTVSWGAHGAAEASSGAGGGGGAVAAAQQGRGGMAVPAAQQMQQAQSYEQQQFERSVESYYQQHGWHTTNLLPFVDHGSRLRELEQAQKLFAEPQRGRRSADARRSAWERFVAAGGGELAIPGLEPGQVATPVPVGRDRQALMSSASLFHPGLESEVAVSLAACRYFSAVATAGGHVYTFGGGFNGELGGSASWSSAARAVEGLVAELISDNGGATKVVAGGSFCACLTRSGRVVLWGQPRGGGSSNPAAAEGEQLELPHMRARKQGGLVVAEFVDLPAMTDLAAGYSHLIMTDGSRVWALGRRGGVDVGGAGAGGAAEEPWLQPREVLRLEDEGVAHVAAGGFASAAVSGSGGLYMWGTLLEQRAAESLLERSRREGWGHWAYSSTAAPQPAAAAEQWEGWAGLHSLEPALVPGLDSGVRQVALGTAHALAVVA